MFHFKAYEFQITVTTTMGEATSPPILYKPPTSKSKSQYTFTQNITLHVQGFTTKLVSSVKFLWQACHEDKNLNFGSNDSNEKKIIDHNANLLILE